MPALAFFYLVCLFWHFSRRFPAPHLLILVVRGSIFYHVPSLSRSLLRLLCICRLASADRRTFSSFARAVYVCTFFVFVFLPLSLPPSLPLSLPPSLPLSLPPSLPLSLPLLPPFPLPRSPRGGQKPAAGRIFFRHKRKNDEKKEKIFSKKERNRDQNRLTVFRI